MIHVLLKNYGGSITRGISKPNRCLLNFSIYVLRQRCNGVVIAFSQWSPLLLPLLRDQCNFQGFTVYIEVSRSVNHVIITLLSSTEKEAEDRGDEEHRWINHFHSSPALPSYDESTCCRRLQRSEGRFTISGSEPRGERRVVVSSSDDRRNRWMSRTLNEDGAMILRYEHWAVTKQSLKGGSVPTEKFMIRLRTPGHESKTYGHTWIVALEAGDIRGSSKLWCFTGSELQSKRQCEIEDSMKRWNLYLQII